MNELRFDGRTAVVTGAGGNPSLGRAHALLLAQRGANVVVNDIGHLPAALGYPGEASAEAVAKEIRSLGGNAVAFLAHETCPFTGECIESMGGHVSRMYLAHTCGFTAPGMTIETLVERWQEAMAGTDKGILRHDDSDPRQWHIKPYVPVA